MEYDISLSFQINNDVLKGKVVGAFKAFPSIESDDEINEIFSFLDGGDSKRALAELLNTYPAYDLLKSADIRVLKTKVCLDCLAGHEEEEFVSNFMRLISALGGKPLTSKATGEQGDVYTYKFTNNKMSVTYKEPEDEW